MRALGIVELNSIAKGIELTDIILKSSEIEILYSKHTCPGKYMIIITGDVASIEEAIDNAMPKGEKNIIGSFILPNAHEDLINGINKKFNIDVKAIGVMEFTSIASGIIALDKALKSGQVKIIRFNLGNLIGGKCYFVITGFVSDVEESMKNAENSIDSKKILNKIVIPSPDLELTNCL
ncbi:BMC domain-containing protein [Hathewaya massiliensis]|nr:BMC domain-containing protein [Hathewaya massiliensis]